MIATKHSRSKELTWLDKEKQENRALRYATNQSSIFQDEQDSQARLGQIVFIDGALVVSERQMTLKKFLEHHPDNVANGGNVFEVMDHEAEAKAAVKEMDVEFEAQQLSRSLSMKELEAVMRKINPDKVDSMYADEIKRDVRVFAKNNPTLFMRIVGSAEVEHDNTIANIIEAKLIIFKKQDTEVWYNLEDNSKLLFKVPWGEDSMEALTDYFHNNNEGVEKYKELVSILEKL
jgi:hypothetical protein